MVDSVGRLVTTRAARHLRTLLGIASIVVILVTGTVVYLQAQGVELRRAVLDNPSVRVIEVTFRSGGEQARQLAFSDADDVRRLAQRVARGSAIVARYVLPFGMPDESGDERFVEGLAGDTAAVVGVDIDASGIATAADAPSRLTLRVPKVTVSGSGVTSHASSDLQLTIVPQPSGAPIDFFRPRDPAVISVGTRTFADLVRSVFGTGWHEFVEKHDGPSNPFGVNVPQSIFVHVPAIADVVPVADALEAAGFDTMYALRAFDDLAGSVDEAVIAAAAVAGIVALAGVVLTGVTLASYFRLARRDIGALKHFGYAPARIRSMYRARIAMILLASATPGLLMVGVVGWLAELPWTDVVLDAGGLIGVLLVVHVAVELGPLRTHLRADVLDLVHGEREFG